MEIEMNKKTLFTILSIIALTALALSACAGTNSASAAATGQQFGSGNGAGAGQSVNNGTTLQGSGQGRGGNQGGGNGRGNRGSNGQGGQGGGGQAYALEPLNQAEADGLVRAIEEELNAQSFYQSVVDAFGAAAPFDRIVKSEAQHAAALQRLADKYGIAVPEYTGPASQTTFETLEAACQAGVQAEIADAALYDELMAFTSHTDLLRVYENLQKASLNSHLPAFETCQ
jgi:hypothetical protein